VGQEALRLELYRKIATAGDHDGLETVRAEAEDRYGALPPPVGALLAVASLRITCLGEGIDEVSTFRAQVRARPVAESLGHQVAATMKEASYHPATRTLNLEQPPGMGGEALTRWVEGALRSGQEQDASRAV